MYVLEMFCQISEVDRKCDYNLIKRFPPQNDTFGLPLQGILGKYLQVNICAIPCKVLTGTIHLTS